MAGSPPSHVSTRGRVVGLEKALRHVETREGGWAGDSKPLRLAFQVREGLWLCWGMGGDIWQGRGQEFNVMVRRILGRTKVFVSR